MGLPVAGINHISVVTADLDRAMRVWNDRYGIGPWTFHRYGEANMRASVDGEPCAFAFRAAIAQLPRGERIELIQPLDDAGPFARSLAVHGGADHVHHVRFDVDDYDLAVAEMRRAGAPETLAAEFDQGAGSSGPIELRYFETGPDLGFTVELGQAPPGLKMPNPEGAYPAQESR